MGYRVFYSYQSDIDAKLNHKFIRDAIVDAISRVTEYKIDLVEGFYEIGGNPPLAETMLKQSRSSDIFIGDITYTSSKIWQSKGINFFQDSKVYLIEINKPVNLKPAPNPNVLLETGYSWALKDFDRTVLVMNTAFGDPSELPVDMSGLRWPITYNLSNERALKSAKFKKEFNSLSKALEGAIRFAIKASIAYQIEKLRPLMIYSQWLNDHPFPYQDTPYAKKLIGEIRFLMENANKPIRIVGSEGIGKTRLVMESFREDGTTTDLISEDRIVYHDTDSAVGGDISKQLAELKDMDQHKWLVVDNCSDKYHDQLAKYFKNSKVRLLTIETLDSENKVTTANKLLVESSLKDEVFNATAASRFPSMEVSILSEAVENDLETFISLINKGASAEDLSKPSLELIERLVGPENLKKGAISFLTAVGLFEQVGVSGQYANQLETINTLFIKTSEQNLEDLIEELESKNLIKRKGNYIVQNGFRNDLVNNWINNDVDNLDEIIEGVSNARLWYFFKRPFLKLLEIQKNLDHITGPSGILSDNSFVDSPNGAKFLEMLATTFPEVVLEIMKDKIGRM
ncbi:hypothetical protein [Gilvibacter sediminis]|uniref:hypothetical protein n=1 Tax=Gilvibacter sediminis TaxID=379071 RepID=UPI00234FB993|nr:hypothetical protein [Gilvibacter sediminis]MDC7997027.1 hypothetical protein [Gilvibacter sediminis]